MRCERAFFDAVDVESELTSGSSTVLEAESGIGSCRSCRLCELVSCGKDRTACIVELSCVYLVLFLFSAAGNIHSTAVYSDSTHSIFIALRLDAVRSAGNIDLASVERNANVRDYAGLA